VRPLEDSPHAAHARAAIAAPAALAPQAVKAAAKAHSDVSGGGIYVGLGGVALTYLRIAQQVRVEGRHQAAL
jgi:hypothetical protein